MGVMMSAQAVQLMPVQLAQQSTCVITASELQFYDDNDVANQTQQTRHYNPVTLTCSSCPPSSSSGGSTSSLGSCHGS